MQQAPTPTKDFYIFKCALIGNQGVGKSSLIESYLNGTFNQNGLPPTKATTEHLKDKMQVGNLNIQLKISEIPAESVMTTGGITANAFVFLVYDVTNQESFKNLEDYIENFNSNNKNPNKLLYIIANKCDNASRQVPEEQGRRAAETYGCKYFETSA